jgi:hypothetical protein
MITILGVISIFVLLQMWGNTYEELIKKIHATIGMVATMLTAIITVVIQKNNFN